MALPWQKWLNTGKQVILKADFLALWSAVSTQGLVRMQPPLVWVNSSTVRIEATPDCVAAMQLTGMPNILDPAVQVSGGLSDGVVRTVTTPVTMDLASGGLYGTTQTEHYSQWYGVYALAGNSDTTFTLRAIPFMRVQGQTGQAIKCGTNVTPASQLNYGFTDAELVGAKIYFITGAYKGLIRSITANVVDTATKITYGGSALTVAAGDWFMILPATNFRLVGAIYNDSSSNIQQFTQDGNQVNWMVPFTIAGPTAAPNTEDVTCAPPTAVSLGVRGQYSVTIGHPDGTNYIELGAPAYELTYSEITEGSPPYNWQGVSGTLTQAVRATYSSSRRTFAEVPIKNCRYKGTSATGDVIAVYFKYPPGCGY